VVDYFSLPEGFWVFVFFVVVVGCGGRFQLQRAGTGDNGVSRGGRNRGAAGSLVEVNRFPSPAARIFLFFVAENRWVGGGGRYGPISTCSGTWL